MRKYILDYLKKQNPKLIYLSEEKTGFFSYIYRIWLSENSKINSLFVIYTPIAILDFPRKNIETVTLFERLDLMVDCHDQYEDAVRSKMPNLGYFMGLYLYSCDAVVKIICEKGKENSIESCHLLSFDCVDSRLGIFTVLYQIGGCTDYALLILGQVNCIIPPRKEFDQLKLFFNELFGDYFVIKLIREGVL